MERMRQAFLSIPDVLIITDRYLNILEFNRGGPFPDMRAGRRLTRFLPDLRGECEDVITVGDRTFLRSVSAVKERGVPVGYTVLLTDNTEKVRLLEEIRQKRQELEELIETQRRANEELSRYAIQAEQLADCGEQLRIARNIHDNAGHAITAVHSICHMCLRLRETDPVQFDALLAEGISLCDRALRAGERVSFRSLGELLEAFRAESPFPVEVSVVGEEPAFADTLHDVVYAVCKEALSNTMFHSLADSMRIAVECSKDTLALSVTDNGSFRGEFRKGFGLAALTEKVEGSGGSVSFRAEEGLGFGITVKWRRQA